MEFTMNFKQLETYIMKSKVYKSLTKKKRKAL